MLENSYFCSIANNLTYVYHSRQWLWFAWKLVLLQYRKQQLDRLAVLAAVVICLKTRTFAVSQTTSLSGWCVQVRLWFAWKLVLLQYSKQLALGVIRAACGCDLLENSYFCSIANNSFPNKYQGDGVVICLKTRTFAVSQTTLLLLGNVAPSCDLLENSYFCSIANNSAAIRAISLSVVICLKTRTFAVSQTTWIPKQFTRLSCDLLENSYFCSIANNCDWVIELSVPVVICLKTRTFAVSQTT